MVVEAVMDEDRALQCPSNSKLIMLVISVILSVIIRPNNLAGRIVEYVSELPGLQHYKGCGVNRVS